MENFGTAVQGNRIQRRMRIACWTRKATNTLSEYVTTTAFIYCNNRQAKSLGVTLYFTLPVLWGSILM